LRWRWAPLVVGASLAAAGLAACRKSEAPAPEAPGSAASAEAARHPPFGYIEKPKENDIVASGAPGSGWALDDSGVSRVDVSLDNGPSVRAVLGQPFPGVREAYPTYPNSDRAGFSFTMPSAASGPHLLVVTITAKDGGKTDLKRHIRIP